MSAIESLAQYAQSRNALLQRIVAVLQDDPRMLAAWLLGSYAAGTADEWSDLDLHVVIRDQDFAQTIENRMELYRRVGQPSLAQNPRHTGPSFFVLLLYPDGIEVDWSLWSLADARRPAWSRLLFDKFGVPVIPLQAVPLEDRAPGVQYWLEFFWAMAAVGVKNAGRSHTQWAAHSFDLMTIAFDGLWRLLYRPAGPDPALLEVRHRPAEPELRARMPQLGLVIDPPGLLAAIRTMCAEVEKMHPDIAALNVDVPVAAPREIAYLARLAAAAIAKAP